MTCKNYTFLKPKNNPLFEMGRQSRLKHVRKLETIANLTQRPGISRRRLLGIGITVLGAGFTRGDVGVLLDSRQSLDDLISRYGKVIYEQNTNAENTLYIIGQVHNNSGLDSQDKNVSIDTAHSQLQIYRIIESIGLHGGKFPLLLQEGYDADDDYFDVSRDTIQNANTREDSRKFTDTYIISLLTGLKNKSPIDGAILANMSYGTQFQGWENKQVMERYEKVANTLATTLDKLRNSVAEMKSLANINTEKESNGKLNFNRLFEQSETYQEEMDELIKLGDYFKYYKSLLILQNSPRVLEREFQKGRIIKLEGISIIGQLHLPEMIQFLKSGRAEIPGINPKYFTGFGQFPSISEPVILPKYHIIVIQPH